MALTPFSVQKYSPLGNPFVPQAAVTQATTSTVDWLALSLTPGPGSTKARQLEMTYGKISRQKFDLC